jgi:hypothetical protein
VRAGADLQRREPGLTRPPGTRLSLPGSEWDRSPREDPDCYPGPIPPFAFRFGGAWIEPLGSERHVAELERHEVAVLAYGSNACPGQLRRKLGDHVSDPPVVLPVVVDGLLVVFADLLARYGSVPATVAASPLVRDERTHVLLCSAAVAEVIDGTEGGYHRLPLHPEVHPVRLVAGRAPVPGCSAYVGVRGPLRDHRGALVPLAALAQPEAREVHAAARGR